MILYPFLILLAFACAIAHMWADNRHEAERIAKLLGDDE